MNPAALIYSHSVSPRLQYIADFLSQYYGLSFRLVYDEEKFLASPTPCKINYSYHRLKDEIFIHPHALLFETSVRQVKTECFEKNGVKVFFKTEGDTGFDLFAAVFYLLSRYEEYLPHKKDNYGRYAYENSIAYREKFLELPLVNIWLEDFRKLLAAADSQFSTLRSPFSFLPTYDIDMAWSFRNKGFKRNAAALFALLLTARFRKLSQRLRVLRKKRTDPFDAYEWMDGIHKKYGLQPVYFFLVAKDTGRYDKNISPQHPAFRELVKQHAAQYPVGLHPSWASGDSPQLLSAEKKMLEEITAQKIRSSRQHYIRFELPQTFQRLISAGITEEYSMGYGSINGFRASVATPFYWYNLKKEETTSLRIHPFCFMDANAYYEQKLGPEAALQEMMEYLETIRNVNGTMITIWHNSFLGTSPELAGWKEVYEKFLSAVRA